MYLHKTKNGHYTPPCCYFSGELEVVECLPQTFSGGMMVYLEYHGHVFEGRFKSCIVKDDSYFLQTRGKYCSKRIESVWFYRRTVIRWKSARMLWNLADDISSKEEWD